MSFSEKIKDARLAAGLSQNELAKRAGIHYRTVQNWESGGRLPRSLDSVMRAAQVLGTTSEALLGESEQYIVEAHEKGGAKAARDVEALVGEVIGLFAGGDIDDEEKDGIMAALNEAYWIAKQKNAKYTPKKYRNTSGDVK